MKIRIRSRDFKLTLDQRGQVERRLGLELARYAARIGAVTLLVTRGAKTEAGFDQRCQLEVSIAPRTVRTELADADLLEALAGAAQRSARTIARLIELEMLPAH